MKNLVFNVFGNTSNNGEKSAATAVCSCRGWSKIRLFQVNKLMSCRGWSKIALYTAQ
jgi:hypothetical protein